MVGAAAQSESITGTLELAPQAGAASHPIQVWSASDPRLSGEAVQRGDWSFYPEASETAGQPRRLDEVPSYELSNDGGSWRCVVSSPDGPEPDIDTHSMVFVGSGDYEGLTATVRLDWSSYPFAFSGVILAGDPPDDPTLAG
jgi:hypothetical protein